MHQQQLRPRRCSCTRQASGSGPLQQSDAVNPKTRLLAMLRLLDHLRADERIVAERAVLLLTNAAM